MVKGRLKFIPLKDLESNEMMVHYYSTRAKITNPKPYAILCVLGSTSLEMEINGITSTAEIYEEEMRAAMPFNPNNTALMYMHLINKHIIAYSDSHILHENYLNNGESIVVFDAAEGKNYTAVIIEY